MHRLSEIDKEARQGVCSECGPVSLYYQASRNYYTCSEKERERAKKKSWKRRGHAGEYDANLRHVFLANQGNACAICRIKITSSTGQLDHDHITGRNRGMLCRECNLGISRFKDRPDLLIAAAKYLS